MVSLRSSSSLLLLLSAAIGGSLAQDLFSLPIPLPNGPYNTTFTNAKLVDLSRDDPYAESPEPRALMVSLFHPAECEATQLVDYSTPATAAFSNQYLGVPNGTFELIKLQVCESDSSTYPSSSESDFPVLVFSPGFGGLRSWYNGIAQWVASYGYNVVTIDHTYDSAFVEFPDGTTVPGAIDTNNTSEEIVNAAVEVRKRDARFVLDQMAIPSVICELIPGAHEGLKVAQAGVFGHSLGGATAANAMLIDPRMKGGINLDGAMYGPARDVDQPLPFEIFGTPTHNRTTDPTWEVFWSHLQGWKKGFVYTGAEHLTYTDGPTLLELAGLDSGALPPEFPMGDVDGLKNLELLSDYVRSFFDLVLKDEGEGVPTKQYPEMKEDNF